MAPNLCFIVTSSIIEEPCTWKLPQSITGEANDAKFQLIHGNQLFSVWKPNQPLHMTVNFGQAFPTVSSFGSASAENRTAYKPKLKAAKSIMDIVEEIKPH